MWPAKQHMHGIGPATCGLPVRTSWELGDVQQNAHVMALQPWSACMRNMSRAAFGGRRVVCLEIGPGFSAALSVALAGGCADAVSHVQHDGV